MRLPRSLLVLGSLLASTLLGCHHHRDDLGGTGGVPAVAGINVFDARVSPAMVSLTLSDADGDPASIQLVFFQLGQATPTILTLQGNPTLTGLPADPGGTPYTFFWDFEADLGPAFVEGIEVRADILNGVQSILSSATASNVSLGNDSPEVVDIATVPGPTTGNVLVPFSIADSSDDLVEICVEYDILGDVPDLGFQLARPSGLQPGDPTPQFAFSAVQAFRFGVDLTFDWDAVFDVGSVDVPAVLRFSIEDDLVPGVPLTSGTMLLDNNSSAAILNLLVTDTRESPATVSFRLTDTEADPQNVALFFTRSGAMTLEPMTLMVPGSDSNLGADLAGVDHSLLWDFETDLGGTGFMPDFTATTQVLEGGNAVASVVSGSFDAGNDAPVVTQVFPAPGVEITGAFSFSISVADSSGDPVMVAVEYDIVGDMPDAGFQLARPVGLAQGDPIPPLAIDLGSVDPAGTSASFSWDVVGDQGTEDFSAILQFRPQDDLLIGDPVLSTTVDFDNNASARAEIIGSAIAANTDQRRGLPIPFAVFDAESDPVTLALQWREASGTYPTLPADVDALRLALQNPDQRRQLQIAREYGSLYSGRLQPLVAASNPNGDMVGLPTLGSTSAGAVATGITGDRLEILNNPLMPVATGNSWDLSGPVAALAVGSGPSILVLDSQSFGTWQLREMDFATGEELNAIASGSEGFPFAMDFQRGSLGRVVIAVGDGNSWSLHGVDLSNGMTTELVPATSVVAGPVRSVKSLNADSAVLTVGDALVRADFTVGDPAIAVPVVRGFGMPWGLALHPTRADRVYLAEAAASVTSAMAGVLEVDLSTGSITPLTQNELLLPRSIAISPEGTRLVALTDKDSGDGTFELTSFTLGGPNGSATTEIMQGLTDGLSSVALGGDGLTLLTLASQGDLAVAGGVQQVRRITNIQLGRSIVTVDKPFDPEITSNLRWRLSEGFDDFETNPNGTGGLIIWDSSDVTVGGQVMLRGLALDTDIGIAGAEFALPQTIAAPLDVKSVTYPAVSGRPVTDFAAIDLDGDGDVDLATIGGEDSFAIATQQPLGTFTTGQTTQIEAGVEAVSIVAADLNGNGLVDLAIGDLNGDIFVYEQDLAGVFGPSAMRLTTAPISSLAVGDLNGDGRVDLVATHPDSDTASLYFGSASFFQSAPDLEFTDAVAGPAQARIADLNGDGLSDLAIANRTDGTVALYYQNAGGGIDSVVNVVLVGPANAEAAALALSDLDLDGDRDLVVAYDNLDQVGFFTQVAGGTFQPSTEFIGDSASIADPFEVVVADADGDQDLDLIVSSRTTTKISVFLRGADGSYSIQPSLLLGSPSDTNGALGIAALDFNGDGRTDIAAARGDEMRLDVFYQSRPGDFLSTPSLLSNPMVSERAVFVQPADFDGDGDLDVALANRADNNVTMYFQNGPGNFEPSPNGPIGQDDFDGVTALAIGDLDQDGDLDLAGVLTGSSRLGVTFQSSPGVFSFDPATGILGKFPPTFRPRSLAIGDLDSDGDSDIVSANTGGGTLSVFLQSTPGVFPILPSFDLSSGTFTQRPNVVLALDIDGDSDCDLVVANRGNKFDPDRSGITIFLQNNGTFQTAPEVSLVNLVPVTEMIDVVATDINGDGDLDLVAADFKAGALLVIEQTSPGSFVFNNQLLTVPGTTIAPISVEAADFNGDGLVDVASIDALSNTICVFLQFAPGQFRHDPQVSLTSLAPGGVSVSISAADYDSDGDVDIISADSNGGAQTIHFGGR